MRLPMKNLNLWSNTIETIVFDFDGTLADTLEASLITFKSTLQHLNINLPIPIDIKTYGPLSVAGMFRTAGIAEENRLSETIAYYKKLYQRIAPRRAKLFPGVKQALNRLIQEGYDLVIATNESRQNLDVLMKCFGIEHIFCVTCCADEVRRPKPWPDIGEKVLQQTGAAAANTLMVGDSVCDIEMAQQTGMKACAVGWGGTPLHRLIDSSPDWAITETCQLFHILSTSQKTPNFKHVLVNGTGRISETLLAS